MLAWRQGFYGHVIATSAFLVFAVFGGVYYSLSVLAPVMAEDLGWSASAFGAAFSVFALVTGICAPLAGAFVVRFGPRLAILGGSVVVAAAFVLLSTTASTWQFYVFIFLLGMGVIQGARLPTQQLVGNWFVRRRSLLLGLVLSGAGLGGLAITTLAAGLVSATASWRASWLAMAALMLAPALLALLLLRKRPGELGQRADGSSQEPDLKADIEAHWPAGRVYRTGQQWETGRAVRTRAFWLIALAGGIKDTTGSYLPAFVLMIGVAVAGALCAGLARPPVSAGVDAALVVLEPQA